MEGHSPGLLLPAIGYVRVSMAREEMVSPQLQRTAIEAAAARDGFRVVKWIEELNVSGTGFARDGVIEAIGIVRDGTPVAGEVARRVYVWKFSRFGRDAVLVGLHVREIETAGGLVVSATEEFDPRSPTGRFGRGIQWTVDEYYSAVMGAQWRAAQARRRAAGLPHNGVPRFGYLYHSSAVTGPCRRGCEPGTCRPGYVPDPETAEHARWLFTAYNGGTGVLRIAVRLNGLSLTTTGGRPWDQRAVRKYMDSGFAAGLLRVHDPACGHPTAKAAQACKRKVLVPGTHSALIGQEVWEEYQRQRAARRTLAPRVESPVYPLAGLIRCGRCGATLNAKTVRGRRGYMYVCNRWFRCRGCEGTWVARHRVEAAVRQWLGEFAEDIGAAAVAERGRTRARVSVDAERRRLEARVSRARSELADLTVKLVRRVVPEDAYTTARDRLLAEQATAEGALAALAPPPPDLGPYVEVTAGLAAEWDTLPQGRLRAVLATVIDRVTIHTGCGQRAWAEVTSVWGEVYPYDLW